MPASPRWLLEFLSSEGPSPMPPLGPGDQLELTCTTGLWRRPDPRRCIVGSSAKRADIRLQAGEQLIAAEEMRFYMSGSGIEAQVLQPGNSIRGQSYEPLQYVSLADGDELSIGPLRFRLRCQPT